MIKKVTTKGALAAAVDTIKIAIYSVGGFAGIMYAAVIPKDIAMWFFLAAGVFLLFEALYFLGRVTNPTANYETVDVDE